MSNHSKQDFLNSQRAAMEAVGLPMGKFIAFDEIPRQISPLVFAPTNRIKAQITHLLEPTLLVRSQEKKLTS